MSVTFRFIFRYNESVKYYLKFLSLAYLIGGMFHFLDILDLRLIFSKMNLPWKVWTIYLFLGDLGAAYGLWNGRRLGVILFIIISISQLFIYSLYSDIFGRQSFLISFHLITLIIFIFLSIKRKRKTLNSL